MGQKGSPISDLPQQESDLLLQINAMRNSLEELQALKKALSEFDDPDKRPRDPSDPLIYPQSIRTKMIDGLVEGWGPAAFRVTPELKARYPDIDDPGFWAIADKALPYTALSVQRLYAIYQAVKYVVQSDVRGDIIECGVFKGGSALMLAESLVHFGDVSRRIFLFDTFEGWPSPTNEDTDFFGQNHKKLYEADISKANDSERSAESSVFRLKNFFEKTKGVVLNGTTYPADKIFFIQGLVEQTLPCPEVKKICILRLDTDYYESTAWEMNILWPRLKVGGVLLIDDYGQFHGARKAVDEYLQKNRISILLHRDDVTGRSVVKHGSGRGISLIRALFRRVANIG